MGMVAPATWVILAAYVPNPATSTPALVEEIGHKLRQSRRLPFGYAEVKNKMVPSV